MWNGDLGPYSRTSLGSGLETRPTKTRMKRRWLGTIERLPAQLLRLEAPATPNRGASLAQLKSSHTANAAYLSARLAIACQASRASRVAWTSWTRMMSVDCIANAAATPTVPIRRSSTSRPSSFARNRLRECPIKTGRPSSRNRAIRERISRLCVAVCQIRYRGRARCVLIGCPQLQASSDARQRSR